MPVHRIPRRDVGLLQQVRRTGDTVILPRGELPLTLLERLTAATGNEFALFTRHNERMLIRGTSDSVPISTTSAPNIALQGWKWTAHSHPMRVGEPSTVVLPSAGDIAVLRSMKQSHSIILTSTGLRTGFSANSAPQSGMAFHPPSHRGRTPLRGVYRERLQ